MHPAIVTAFEDEFTKIAVEAEIYGDSTDYRGSQTTDGPPTQEWHRHGALRRRYKAKVEMAKQALDPRQLARRGAQVLQKAPAKMRQMGLKGMARLSTLPGGKALIHHVLDPSNVADISQTVGSLGRFF